MGVLVARSAGANDPDRVNRTVYQAFLTAVVLAVGILAPLGYVLSPRLLEIVHATPAVRAEALPFLRTMFLFSIGHADVLHAQRGACDRPAIRARRCGWAPRSPC